MISFKPNFAAPARFRKWSPQIWSVKGAPLTVGFCNNTHRGHHQPMCAPTPISRRLARVTYGLNRRLLLPKYFQRIQISGQHYIPKDGAVIFAPTHRSRWDALLVPYAIGPCMTGRYPHYMVTIDEMQGLQGWFIRQMGGFAVNTRSPGVASLRHGIELLHQHQALVIFPEGGELLENRQAGVNRLHPGLARIAVKATLTQPDCRVQIVPMAINYEYRHGQVSRGAVDIQIGQAISVNSYLAESGKRSARLITQDLRSAMCDLSAHNIPVMA